jgi:hypothetical protein
MPNTVILGRISLMSGDLRLIVMAYLVLTLGRTSPAPYVSGSAAANARRRYRRESPLCFRRRQKLS